MRKITFLLVALFVGFQLDAQIDSLGWGTNYPAVHERLMVETKWKYTYALHVESKTAIHQADEAYNYFLHFRYDYTYEQFLNDEFSVGTWSLSGSELFYSFKHIQKFEIVKINNSAMVLEFTQANSTGTFQYHFVRVESKDAPFVKPANELPDVIVERLTRRKGKGWLSNRKEKKKKKDRKEDKLIYISIELIGGGYYGGIDPVMRDYIQIKSDGRLIKEFKSVNTGLHVTKKFIPRDELEQFAEYIIAQRFFELDRLYDCESLACQARKRSKPRPIPLRLAIAYGDRKKVVTISIWGNDSRKKDYVDYPPALDNIIQSIQRMAHRIDEL